MMNGRTVWLFFLLCSTGAALQMTGPSSYTARVGSIAHIPCTFTADTLPVDPRFFAVLWFLEGKYIIGDDNTGTDPRYSLDKDRTLNGIADLTISNAFLSDSGIYTCSLTYSPLRTEKKIKVEISGSALQMTGPSTYTITRVGSISHIPCTFTADKLPADPRYFSVVWYLQEKNILSYNDDVTSTDSRYSLNKHQALRGIANLTISDTAVSDGGVYACLVNYSFFLMKKEIRVNILAPPLLFILGKSVQKNRENTLTCMANGYFPNDINVTWYKDGEVLKNQLMGEPLQYDNGTYQVKSDATITPSDDDQKKTFTCRVQHASLQEPLQEDFQLTYQVPSMHIFFICAIAAFVVIAVGIIICSLRLKLWRKGLPDPKMKDIKVSELIEGKRATLECRISNYVMGTHRVQWRVKEKSSDEFVEVKSASKIPTLTNDGSTYVAELALLPVQKSDDGSEFLCKVGLPDSDRMMEKCTGPIHVEGLPDPKMEDIKVPKLIEGKRATLECRIFNYMVGTHRVIWYVKEKSSEKFIEVKSASKIPTIIKNGLYTDYYVAELALLPVQKSDDGSEFLCRVDLPDSERKTEKCTGPIHVEGKNQIRGGEEEESTIFNNMDVKDLTQNPSHSSYEKEDSGELLTKMEKQHTGD